jgi:hypothetical protein
MSPLMQRACSFPSLHMAPSASAQSQSASFPRSLRIHPTQPAHTAHAYCASSLRPQKRTKKEWRPRGRHSVLMPNARALSGLSCRRGLIESITFLPVTM